MSEYCKAGYRGPKVIERLLHNGSKKGQPGKMKMAPDEHAHWTRSQTKLTPRQA